MSLRLRILQVDVPAASLDAATTFWAGALSATAVQAPGVFVHLLDASSVVEVHIHPLGGGAARYHLDLEAMPTAAGDPERLRDVEVARLVGLGAAEGPRFDAGYTVVDDPAGMPLCVITADAAAPNPLAPRRADRGHLDAIRLEVPVHDLEAEVAFWAAALGATSHPPQDADQGRPLLGVTGPGGDVDLEVQRIAGRARIHVELSASDPPSEAARLTGLGATRIAGTDTRITLVDPAGNLLCVVPARDGDET